MVANQLAILCGIILLANAGSVVESKINPVKGNIGTQCSSVSGVEYQTFNVTPYPPQRNQNLNLDTVIKADQDVDITAFHVNVKYAGVDFYAEDLAVSAKISAGNTQDVKIQVYLPGIAPPGKYSVQVKPKDKSGALYTCWDVDFSL